MSAPNSLAVAAQKMKNKIEKIMIYSGINVSVIINIDIRIKAKINKRVDVLKNSSCLESVLVVREKLLLISFFCD